MLKKILPVGTDNFEDVRTEDFYYIDKTGLIKELLENRGKVSLFTHKQSQNTHGIVGETLQEKGYSSD